MQDYIYVDQKGYEQMLEKIQKLKQDLIDNSKVKGEAASGDAGNSTHDNFDYEQAKQRELMILSEIDRAYKNLERVKIVEKTGDDSIVDIDDEIRIEMNFEGDIEEMDIILIGGSVEGLDYTKAVSINSPLGKSVYKRKVGETSSYTVNDIEVFVKILKKLSKEQEPEVGNGPKR